MLAVTDTYCGSVPVPLLLLHILERVSKQGNVF